jgi:hypothetical protein
MLFCNRNFSPIQRRSGVLFGSNLILTMILFAVAYDAPERFSISKPLLHLLEIPPAIPVAAMIFIVGRYLGRETDEFVRLLVTRALLWGLGVTMVANIVLNVLFEGGNAYGPSQIFDIDIFCVTAMIALLIQLRRNQ